MITYDLTQTDIPLYKALYELIKADIINGRLLPDQKMPSKRTFAANQGVSTISIENAYDQLISEGYMYTIPKKGYFVAKINAPQQLTVSVLSTGKPILPQKNETWTFNFSSNVVDPLGFPFSIWAKMIRETISTRKKELLEVSDCGGVLELRQAIAGHLQSFRGMVVNPDQIIVGAGTEYLYSILIKLLSNDHIFCIENPGYSKIKQIYENNGAVCQIAEMDEHGIIVDELKKKNADVAHVSPTHHFPTGITMPVSRRYELLAWASEKENRIIIEDDYDSEFRLNGKPVPTLQSLDAFGKVIYMNTFSKSLTSTIRISYMVLPEELARQFYEKLSFYSCTVSTFEQYALAAFIKQGYFEKHINRMRHNYGRKRERIMEIIRARFNSNQCELIENDSGLHFILKINTPLSDNQVKEVFARYGAKINSVCDYEMTESLKSSHQFILNYSGMDTEALRKILNEIDFSEIFPNE